MDRRSNTVRVAGRLWLVALALLAIAFLERFVHYGTQADIVLFLTDAVEAGGLGLTSSAATELYGSYRLLAVPAAMLAGVVGFLLRPRITLALGLAAMAVGNLLLPGIQPDHVLLPLAIQTMGHGLASVGIIVGAGDLFDKRSQRLALFFALCATFSLSALSGPALLAPLAGRGSHAGTFMVSAGVLFAGTVLAVAFSFLRTPSRKKVGGVFRGVYATTLFGGALIWFWVLVMVGLQWSHELLREVDFASPAPTPSFAPATIIVVAVMLAIAARTGVLTRKPCSDNRLTAWGLALIALGTALLILAYQADPARWTSLLRARDVLSSVAETLMYAALAVMASASGPRLSSLFIGIYLGVTSLTTSAVTSLVFSHGLAWPLVIVTLLLAAVIGSWHWHEHVAPD